MYASEKERKKRERVFILKKKLHYKNSELSSREVKSKIYYLFSC